MLDLEMGDFSPAALPRPAGHAAAVA